MKIIHFNLGDFEWEATDAILNVINGIDDRKNAILKIHLKSSGGYTSAMFQIYRLLEDINYEIHVIQAESAAFELLNLLDNDKIFFNIKSTGMYHLGSLRISYRDGLKNNSLVRLQEWESNEELKNCIEVMDKLKFTKTERKDLLDEKDVYFNSERLKEMFKK